MARPVLYILMRNDLSSMNPGKAMAQASHASNMFVKFAKDHKLKRMWQDSTEQGFGTVLVLAVSGEEMAKVMSLCAKADIESGTVEDPTYPYKVTKELAELISPRLDTSERIVRGNEVTLFRREFTCCYVFGCQSDARLKEIVGKFPLHP